MPKPSFSRSNNTAKNPKADKKQGMSTTNKVFGIISVIIVTYYFMMNLGSKPAVPTTPAQSKDQPAATQPANPESKPTTESSGIINTEVTSATVKSILDTVTGA